MNVLKNKKSIFIILIVLVLSGSIILMNKLNNEESKIDTSNDIAYVETTTNTTTTSKIDEFYVDVKGEVKNPGVYVANSNMIVNQLIQAAGGLTKNSYTKNINLAQSVTKGMVIYVFSKKEMTTTKILSDAICTTNTITYNQTNNINDDNNTKSSGLVNINTASKEELMSLSGIGEKKADAIIEYRKSNPFKSIEDIKNVSGIGESYYSKIKDNITVN